MDDAKELFCIHPPIDAFADEHLLLVLVVRSEGVAAEAHEFAHRVQRNRATGPLN